MKKTTVIIVTTLLAFGLGFYIKSFARTSQEAKLNNSKVEEMNSNMENMKLGAFSISLSVKDIHASKAFYEKLGFTVFGGDLKKNYLIMKNENTLIGIFQGMFEGNMLTFNPGWDQDAKDLDDYTDIRKIQRHLKENGIAINQEADENTSGPASFVVTDPDGNILLFDQHR